MALIAEIVGGVAIVVSVLYLAFEISQNTANMKAGNAMSLATEINELRFARVQDSDLDTLVRSGQADFDSLSEGDRSRFFSYFLVRLTNLDRLFYMDEQGLLPPGYADTLLPGFCASLAAPGYRSLWAGPVSNFYSESLRQFMADCYSE